MSAAPACVVGVMPSPEALEAVLVDLRTKGFEAEQFGVLVASADDHGSFAELAAHPESETTLEATIVSGLVYVGAVTAAGAAVLAGGGLAAILLAVASGGGASGLVGLLAAAGFHRHHAEAVGRHLDQEGIVVWIAPRTADQWNLANVALIQGSALEVMTNGEPPA